MTDRPRESVAAVVLAGGQSLRFGSDKLAHPFEDSTLVGHLVDALPQDWEIVVVGPRRPFARPVTYTREDPPGTGPAAALLAGIRAAHARGAERVVCLPGDAPYGVGAARALLAALDRTDCCVGVDRHGLRQPLDVALRGAALTAFVALDPVDLADASARRVINTFDPIEVELAEEWLRDVDTPDDLSGLPTR